MVKTAIKKSLKSLLYSLEERNNFVRERVYVGYLEIPLKLLIVNFIFQRILRINCETPWSVHFTSKVVYPQNLKIGKNAGKCLATSNGCYIQAGNGIEIGTGTIWGPGVKIISANHDVLLADRNWVEDQPIRIGSNCWVGANAVILSGVQLGDNLIVGAGAIVTKSFPEGNCVVAGNPARIIRRLLV